MIELTVKTLDSQNHAFSVPDDTTVKQLKERIAESISFPVESQRLIYCGRVLQDDKNLSEYDVNGKVIHLVQRPPPQATRNGGQQRSSGGQQGRRGNHHFRQPRLDGNAMYLGAMAFPADLMDAQGIQAPPSSHNLSDSRMLLARRMLRRASVVLNRLENPTISEASDPDSPPDEQQQDTASSAASAAAAAAAAAATQAASAATQAASAAVSAASAIAEAASGPSSGSEGGDLQSLEEGLQQGLPLAQAAQAATAAAIAAAVSAAHAAGVPNITIVRSGSSTGSSGGSGQAGADVDVRMEGVDEEGNADQEAGGSQSNVTADSVESPAGTGVEASEGGAAVASTSASTSASASASAPSAQAGSSSDDVPRTTVLADLLDELNRVNTRLQPFMQQYHSLMRDYPNPENNASTQESHRVFSSVSEIMHFLSHAYHALSDIMCDFTQPPPRALRCRPVLIQHSAVLQAGIPIQAQINVMTNRNNPNNNNNISTNNNGSSASAQGPSPSAVPVAASAASEPESVDVAAEQTSNTAAQDKPAFNITPGNVEFFMEVGPGSITIDSLEATVVTNSGSIGDGIQANVVGGSFPWGAPPPPEFIQNLMQAVAGHMIGRGGSGGSGGAAGASTSASASTSPSSSSSTSTSTSGAAGSGGGGQNSQARGNTATHPTTATQTRSTARPHVHLAPATVQGLGASGFDPFLPCNSHHIRSRTRTSHTLSHHLAASPSPSSSTTTATTSPAPTATVETAGRSPSSKMPLHLPMQALLHSPAQSLQPQPTTTTHKSHIPTHNHNPNPNHNHNHNHNPNPIPNPNSLRVSPASSTCSPISLAVCLLAVPQRLSTYQTSSNP
ncbi:Uncharacterized protein GBIM_10621 [Gryllus bimaculatus]|nr:Uncharacterized protein GBIM_10621 [Gryllus bimaculatus]